MLKTNESEGNISNLDKKILIESKVINSLEDIPNQS